MIPPPAPPPPLKLDDDINTKSLNRIPDPPSPKLKQKEAASQKNKWTKNFNSNFYLQSKDLKFSDFTKFLPKDNHPYILCFDWDQTIKMPRPSNFSGSKSLIFRGSKNNEENHDQLRVLQDAARGALGCFIVTAASGGRFPPSSTAIEVNQLVGDLFGEIREEGNKYEGSWRGQVNGTPVSRIRNIYSCEEKEVAVKMILEEFPPDVGIIFVDDGFDNAAGVFLEFGGSKSEQRVTSIWFEPEVEGGEQENLKPLFQGPDAIENILLPSGSKASENINM